jgi:hypothetical protein
MTELAPPGLVAVALRPWGQEFRVKDGYAEVAGHEVEVLVHSAEDCRLVNGHCVFHAPSDHPLKNAPMILRLDKQALVERVCEHGVGHDDPDSCAFLEEALGDWPGIHGCDGCC